MEEDILAVSVGWGGGEDGAVLTSAKQTSICFFSVQYFKTLFSMSIFCIFAMQKPELVWCPVYKAASTNWMHNLLYLTGLTDHQVPPLHI
jgi:hypothetical protein